MATYYVLDGSPLNNRVRIAIHVDVPAGNNDAGRAWSSVLTEYLESTVSQVSWLTPAVQSELDAGTKYEIVRNFEDDANKTLLQRRNALDAYVIAEASAETARLSSVLRFWGTERVV